MTQMTSVQWDRWIVWVLKGKVITKLKLKT